MKHIYYFSFSILSRSNSPPRKVLSCHSQNHVSLIIALRQQPNRRRHSPSFSEEHSHAAYARGQLAETASFSELSERAAGKECFLAANLVSTHPSDERGSFDVRYIRSVLGPHKVKRTFRFLGGKARHRNALVCCKITSYCSVQDARQQPGSMLMSRENLFASSPAGTGVVTLTGL